MKRFISLTVMALMLSCISAIAAPSLNSSIKGKWYLDNEYDTGTDVYLKFTPSGTRSGSITIFMVSNIEDEYGRELDMEVTVKGTYTVVSDYELRVKMSPQSAAITHFDLKGFDSATEAEKRQAKNMMMREVKKAMPGMVRQFKHLYINDADDNVIQISDGVENYNAFRVKE